MKKAKSSRIIIEKIVEIKATPELQKKMDIIGRLLLKKKGKKL